MSALDPHPHPRAGDRPAGVPPVARVGWRAWGTSVSLLVQPAGSLEDARRLLEEEIAATDAACSRFRPDSELARLNAAGGRTV
ncbi:MAG: hypothetical protein ACRDZR_03015, partial [Acidimicrobiales bacterium]